MSWVYELVYLVSAVCFILGLKDLSSPETARRGMHFAEFGMLAAVVGTLLQVVDFGWIIAGMLVGTAAGSVIAIWTPMTAMPQRTALSHAFGALAAALVGIAEFYEHGTELTKVQLTAIGFECMLGALTFTGSLMAFAKLQELMRGSPITYRGQNVVNLGLLATTIVLVIVVIAQPAWTPVFYVMLALAFLFGIALVLPIGAADMPTVISLLNSYAGLAASATGFVLDNKVLIIAGALDGASGVVLSIIMCRAMNRSMFNVLFGAFGTPAQGVSPVASGGQVTPTTIDEATGWFRDAKLVIVVPGYGMAAAQAQHGVRELADGLKARGTKVLYAIHPVAGRMPGHMNVLLAEAGVPYDELIDMEEINERFEEADVALVMGANDVTNPAAKRDPASPIYGMPILDVESAKRVIVCKRSMNPGFAGIDNLLYTLPNCAMLFGDARGTADKLARALTTPKVEAAADGARRAIEGADLYQGDVASTVAAEVAALLKAATNVVIVPGYGMAVAQASQAVRDLTRALEGAGKNVSFAVHPVAGRIPGHMNLALADADIPYDRILEPSQVNKRLEYTDVVVAIGANDVLNPDARRNPKSPLAGLDTFDVGRAKQVIVVKRTLRTGYCEVPNPLFQAPNCKLLFADGKTGVGDIVRALAT